MNNPLVDIPCALCGSNDKRLIYRPKRSPGPVVRCRGCGFTFISPREDTRALIMDGPVLGEYPPELLTSHDLQAIGNSWEMPLLKAKEREYPTARLNHQQALERIEKYISPPGSLFDFGCGGGFFLASARERGWKVQGLEPLAGHAVYARAKYNLPVKTDILRDHSFSAECFDLITAFQVFEHIPSPRDDLRRLKGFLKPGGVILIEVPKIDTWSIRLLGRHHRHFVSDHLSFFSARSLRRLLESEGFTVVESYSPGRLMSIDHLVRAWWGRYLPGYFIRWVMRWMHAWKLDQRHIKVNLGDILTMIGRLPD